MGRNCARVVPLSRAFQPDRRAMPDNPASYCSLAEAIEWRRNAQLAEWVSFASGEQLERQHPVKALVRGWERQGLVEVASDRELGWLRHRFRRLVADFPIGCLDAGRSALPDPPASKRDLAVVGLGGMVWAAAGGDEDVGWIRYAAQTTARDLGHFSARLSENKRLRGIGQASAPPEGIEAALAQAHMLLVTLATMLNPEGETVLQVKVQGRKPGKVPNPSSRARKEWEAAAAVRKAVESGHKKTAAIADATEKRRLSESRIKTRLAAWKRMEDAPQLEMLGSAARLVEAMMVGGMLQSAALGHVTEVLEVRRGELVKYMRSKEFKEKR